MWPSFVLVLACVAIGHTVPTSPPHYDTIIVGLGAAGCTAAKTLCDAGKKVLGLEAQNRIGGRVYTIPFGDGIVEVGAEWIHGSTHSRTYELAIKNNVTILNQEFDFAVYRSDGSKGDEALVNELVNYSLELTNDPPEKPEPLGQFTTRKLLVYLEKNHPTVAQDQDFVTQFLHTLDLIVNGYEGSSSWNEISTQSCYEELGGSQQLSWHRNGYKTLFEILLNTYNNGTGLPTLDIKLNKEVSTISYPQNPSDNVEVTCKDGTVYTAKNVIVTVSVGVLKERHATLFSTPLPSAKIEAIQTIPFGVVMKIILSFDHVWWSGSTVFIWREVDKKEIAKEDLWTADVEGGSIMMGCGNCLSFWITGEHVKLVETLPEHEVKTKLMAVIRRFVGKNTTIPEPTKMLRTTWFSNPFTRGTYSYENHSTNQHPSARPDLASPLMDSSGAPRVLFAGEATDSIHYSTVHGATDTGFREASRILSYKGNN